jgi:hypothetical protein
MNNAGPPDGSLQRSTSLKSSPGITNTGIINGTCIVVICPYRISKDKYCDNTVPITDSYGLPTGRTFCTAHEPPKGSLRITVKTSKPILIPFK